MKYLKNIFKDSRKTFSLIVIALFVVSVASLFNVVRQAQALPQTHFHLPTLKARVSWYGHPFHGRKTANGETYNMNAYTAAHKTLPFNTVILLTNPKNNKQVFVRINDRGPYVTGRMFDLSYKAAQELGLDKQGVGDMQVRVYLPKTKTAYALNKKTRQAASAEVM